MNSIHRGTAAEEMTDQLCRYIDNQYLCEKEELEEEIKRLRNALEVAERIIMELQHRGVRGCKA